MRRFLVWMKVLVILLAAVAAVWAAFIYVPQMKYGFVKPKTEIPENSGMRNKDKVGNEERRQEDGTGQSHNGSGDRMNEPSKSGDGEDQYNIPFPYDSRNNPRNAGQYLLTADEVLAIGSISFSDRVSALALFSKIRKGDIEKIVRLAEDGITVDEAKELEVILKSNLSTGEIDKLYTIFAKNKKLFAEGKLGK